LYIPISLSLNPDALNSFKEINALESIYLFLGTCLYFHFSLFNELPSRLLPEPFRTPCFFQAGLQR
jgi:hypothetical protein